MFTNDKLLVTKEELNDLRRQGKVIEVKENRFAKYAYRPRPIVFDKTVPAPYSTETAMLSKLAIEDSNKWKETLSNFQPTLAPTFQPPALIIPPANFHANTLPTPPANFQPQPLPTPPVSFQQQPLPLQIPPASFQPQPLPTPPVSFQPQPLPLQIPPASFQPQPLATTKETKVSSRNPVVRKRKEKIPAAVRKIVWNTYIGREKTSEKCFCCNSELITLSNFECGHVLSERDGGEPTIQNLRPICGFCNKSIGACHMEDFMKRYGILKRKDWDGVALC